MDGQRFDGLVRKLATGASRRTALKAVAGGAVATALGLGVAASPAAAQKNPSLGQRCDRRRDCPSNQRCKQTSADGGTRCCRTEGGQCGGDRDCCGNNSFCDTDGSTAGTCVRQQRR